MKKHYYYDPDFTSLTDKISKAREMLQYLDSIMPHNVQSEMEIILSDKNIEYKRNETPEGKLIFELDLTKVSILYHIDRIINNDMIEYQLIAQIKDDNIPKYLELWASQNNKNEFFGHIIIGQKKDNFSNEMYLREFFNRINIHFTC